MIQAKHHLMEKAGFVVSSQWFLTLERLLTTKCNISGVMNAIFPLPPSLFCRVDIVLCMFKNLEPPTQPSAVMPCVGKYLSCTHAIRFLWSCSRSRSLFIQLSFQQTVKVTNYSREHNKIIFANCFPISFGVKKWRWSGNYDAAACR